MSNQFFFIVLRIEKLETSLYEWVAEADSSGPPALDSGNGSSIEDCLRGAVGILSASHGVELRYDGFCAGTFIGAEVAERPAEFAAKAAAVTKYFKAVQFSMG
ncbi:hypothetical protein [Cupriavidus metallidurans]|jgi:hypothetical protein|uniref:Uncharacterized protein n=1 Tax=Cupriavidus metallidurans TaxID=119219 RepID=A0A482ITF0_9BURK|nr:hypothetical protein [Cupriavidus metallidurans]QBP10110.1 hypothetical protein DDF84_010250 [Cupriavidus metallidurans]QWC87186.1 hypothetical protein KB891_08790 [Cupriavidus metallidurans]